jgi:hypothetical protein
MSVDVGLLLRPVRTGRGKNVGLHNLISINKSAMTSLDTFAFE